MTNHIYYFEVLGRNDRNRFGIESFNDARSIDLVLFEGLPEMGAYFGRLSRDSYISTNGGPIREISKLDRKLEIVPLDEGTERVLMMHLATHKSNGQ